MLAYIHIWPVNILAYLSLMMCDFYSIKSFNIFHNYGNKAINCVNIMFYMKLKIEKFYVRYKFVYLN